MERYSLGIDFGTLSARAVLLDLRDGRVAKSASFVYPHGVMTAPPGGGTGGRRMELQDPADYREALASVVRELLSGEDGGRVAAVGIDFTSCTPLPLTEDLTPLCFLPEWSRFPDAWPKLWRSVALPQGEKIARAAQGEAFLRNTCGKVSPEWLVPKLLELKEEAPALYEQTAYYMEAGDWIVSRLVGEPVRSMNPAAFKSFYRDGFPDGSFFAAVDPAWKNLTDGALKGRVVPVGTPAGRLCRPEAEALGLPEGIPVGGMITDAHAGTYAAGISGAGEMLAVLGTSACYILQEERLRNVPGAAAAVENALLPGLVTYEGTQLMGDGFEAFVRNYCPDAGNSAFERLNRAAAGYAPGASGLTVLDWFGGNRCILGDSALTGVVTGLTLRTKPEEVYHALLEAAVCSMRMILDNYRKADLRIGRIVATGGLARKNPVLMQMMSDMLGQEIELCGAEEGPAVGSAVYAAALTGALSLPEAVQKLSPPTARRWQPDPDRHEAYEAVFRRFTALHDLLGREHPELIRR